MILYAICKTFDAGYEYQQKRMKNLNIQIGDKFKVNRIEMEKWNTDIYLEEFPNEIFNSVFFKFVDENNKKINIYSKNFFYRA